MGPISNLCLEKDMDDDLEPFFTYQANNPWRTEPPVSPTPSRAFRVNNDSVSEPTPSHAREVADHDSQSANDDSEQS